jgi:hypothetical protein
LNVQALIDALLIAREGFKEIHKTQTAKVKTKTGGSFQYSYATLPDTLAGIREGLVAQRILVYQAVQRDELGPYLETKLVHPEGGELVSHYPLPPVVGDPQEFGKAVAYARRYSLYCMCALAPDDDDDGQTYQAPAAATPRPDLGPPPEDPPFPGDEFPPGEPVKAPASPSGEFNSLDWIQRRLQEEFGGDKPWEPVEKPTVLKDLTGSGKWTDLQAMPEAQRRGLLAGKRNSRFEKVIILVKAGTRRPDHINPEDWPVEVV